LDSIPGIWLTATELKRPKPSVVYIATPDIGTPVPVKKDKLDVDISAKVDHTVISLGQVLAP
jgi:hypothetical protein